MVIQLNLPSFNAILSSGKRKPHEAKCGQ